MAEIKVNVTEGKQQYTCEVTVTAGSGSTQHTVTVQKDDYERLTGGDVTPEALVRASFRFLLERESKESILRRFDLMVITRYFPEYEREIQQRI